MQQHLVCLVSILHLSNLVWIAKNAFAVQNSCHLFQGKGVVFNGKRRVNRSDSIFTPQMRADRLGFCKGGAQTTVRRYKGLEAKVVLLVDVHVSKLVKPTCQRLVYVGSSRASAYLETIFLSDVSERSIRRWSSSWIPISNRLHRELRSGSGWRRNNSRNSRITRFEHEKSRLLQIVF